MLSRDKRQYIVEHFFGNICLVNTYRIIQNFSKFEKWIKYNLIFNAAPIYGVTFAASKAISSFKFKRWTLVKYGSQELRHTGDINSSIKNREDKSSFSSTEMISMTRLPTNWPYYRDMIHGYVPRPLSDNRFNGKQTRYNMAGIPA